MGEICKKNTVQMDQHGGYVQDGPNSNRAVTFKQLSKSLYFRYSITELLLFSSNGIPVASLFTDLFEHFWSA